jgi:Tfp pilus assembly protein PilF
LVLNRPDVAVQAYETALAQAPLTAEGNCNLGLVYGRQGLVGKALTCYRTALMLNPQHRSSLANAGHLCARLGHWADAQDFLQRLVAGGCRDLDILLALALAAARQKDREQLASVQQMLGGATCLQHLQTLRDGTVFFQALARHLEADSRKEFAGWAWSIATSLQQMAV